MGKTEYLRESNRAVETPFFGLGEIEYGAEYQDVREELARLPREKVMTLVLMVACDKVVGEWSDRSGSTNCALIKLVRELARGLGLSVSNRDEFLMTSFEARGYYIEIRDDGFDLATEAGLELLDAYCTLRTCINAVARRACKPQERSGYHLSAWGGGEVDLNYVLQPGAEWVYP